MINWAKLKPIFEIAIKICLFLISFRVVINLEYKAVFVT